MEKNTLVAFVVLGCISITALVLSIIGVSGHNHGCMESKGMMPGMMMEARPGIMKRQKNPDMKQLSGMKIHDTTNQ